MAIAATVLASGTSTTDGTSFTTASISPAADSLLLVFTSSSISTGTAPTVTPSGLGLTFTNQAEQGWGSPTSPVRRLVAFTAQCGGSPGSGAISFSMSASSTDCAWVVIEITGHDTTTPVAQAVTAFSDSTSGNTGSITLASPANADSRPFSWWGVRDNVNATPDSGWTELADIVGSSPSMGYDAQWKSDGFDTSAGATFDLAQRWGGIAIEIAASGGAVPAEGTGAGSFAFAGSSAGSTTHEGSAAGTAAYSGSVAGSTVREGIAAGAFAQADSAAGQAIHKGDSAGAFFFAGSAQGLTPGLTPAEGTVTGSFAFSSSPIGARESSGTATGSYDQAGTTAGSVTHEGASTGAYGFAGTTEGTLSAEGTTTGSVAWAGTSAGERVPAGTASGADSWTAVALGGAFAPQGHLGFFVGNAASRTSAENAIRTRLEDLGWTVTFVDDSTTVPVSGYDVLLLSSSGVYPTGAGWDTTPIGVVTMDTNSWRLTFKMASQDGDVLGKSGLNLSATPHPITDGLTSPVVMFTSGGALWFSNDGDLAPGALQLDNEGSRSFLYCFDAGDALTSGTAAGRRVAFGVQDQELQSLTTNGLRLLHQSLQWASSLPESQGSATGSFTTSGSSTGSRPAGGTVTGSFTTVATATGEAELEGLATAAFAFAGTATGVGPEVLERDIVVVADPATTEWSAEAAVGDPLTAEVSVHWSALEPTGSPLVAAEVTPNTLTATEPTASSWSVEPAYFEEP